jgi:hypothetical protein
MNIEVPENFAAFTADGDATGYVTMTSNAGFYAGAIGYLNGPPGSARVIITEISGATKVGVRILAADNEQQAPVQIYGGRSNLTGYTAAGPSKLFMERQLVRVEPQMQSLAKPNV